ncbi:hypothetical protein H072_6433 [Dactylellina haptotyla CBS 200.50]|uniref:Uncharacterized protein n=1 Tax=Dactylellina haptotyla (strain CBS 200.50) TaxID=1284197 RepID=S8AA30_DACHA|nr:hypothetical protein H072_6433 [Dactylellina haptotyla CBS 200.50]
MDIKKLLNPSARGVALPYEGLEEEPIRSNKSSSTSSRVSRQSGSQRGLPADEHHRYHKYATVGSSSGGSMTARSSISSLTSLQSSNSLTSLTTLSSTGSISKGTLGSPIHESLARSKPDFRIPIYAFDITQNSARPPPRGLYTPSESDYSPSTTMTQYFPSHPEVTQDRIPRDEFQGSSLTTLAALAASQDIKRHHLDAEYAESRHPYGTQHYDGASSRSYVSQMRQRADLVPKQSSNYSHISTQDVYAMSKLQLSGTPSTLSPTNTIGPSSSTASIIHSFDADLFSSPKCSYVEDCNTSSPLRKVVSHIFGRNKLSTRQIPKNIWVYYCRKHYQRSRYRDPKGFAKLQCDLVRRQVERLDAWGGVEDWMIKVRRREEIRISKESKATAPHSPDGSDGFDEDYSRRSSLSQGSSDIHWISMMTGTGKNVEDVRYLLQKIESEIIDHGGIFPDVEILPNVRPSAITGDINTSRLTDGEHALEPILEGSKTKKSRGSLIEAFISPRKLPSRRSLEEAMVVTGSTVAAQAKLQKANRPSFIQEYSPPSLDDEDTPSPTRPKRKASKPLPITVLPPDEVNHLPENYHGYGYPQMPPLQEFDPAIEHEKLLKYRSKRARPGYPTFSENWDEPPSPVSTRRHSLDLETDMPPLPILAERLEEQLRFPSTEDLTVAGLPLKPAQSTGEAFCAFEQKDLKIVLVTPPPSVYGDYSRAPSEPVETIDGDIAQLGVIEAQPLLAIDPESDRPVLAVEVPQHVRDFVMGSWSKKRAVRMKNLIGDQIGKPAESCLLGYRTPRRKGSPSGKGPLTKRVGGQAQDYVELAKESVRSGVRQLRTSFALQSEPTEESLLMPSNRKSFSLLAKPNSNSIPPTIPTSSSRRRHRASSAGPAGRSSNPNMSMKRTLTAAPKGALEPSRTLTRGLSNSRII